MTPPPKKMCSQVKIGTHNGHFHCDEVLACWMLKQLPQYKEATILRSRNPDVYNECDIVVDVGGKYNPDNHRYDHHQKEFTDTMNSLDSSNKWTTKLSSAGLVYFHFGRQVIQTFYKESNEKVLQLLYNKMYHNFIEEVDGVDNGVNQYDGTPRYKVTTTIASRVNSFNPLWNEDDADCKKEEAGFYKAMQAVGEVFEDKINYYLKAWLPARKVVEEAFESRKEVDPSGKIVKLNMSCPWKEHLFDIEQENNVGGEILYVLYPDKGSNWRIQCVPKALDSFTNRKSIRKEWCGVRDKELDALSGIEDCIFVHSGGFIGGNKCFEGALKMAQLSVQI